MDASLRGIDSEENDGSFIDAVESLSGPLVTASQPYETVGNGNIFNESESGAQSARPGLGTLLFEPTPLLLLCLLSGPYLLLVYNSLHVGTSLYLVLADMLLYWSHMTIIVLGLLFIIKLYCGRHKLLEWAVRLLYCCYSDIDVLPGIDVDRRSFGVQTDDVDFQRQVDALRNSHSRDMRRIRKHIHHMRKRFSNRIRSLKDLSKERNEILTKLQLKFPGVEQERNTLLAEREAIEKQLEEERRRNKELIGRFQRISQQFSRLGHAQYPPPLMSVDVFGQQPM